MGFEGYPLNTKTLFEMHLTELYPISTSCIQLTSIFLQFKYNKTSKTIQGVSYDYILLQFLAHLTSIIGIFSFHLSTIKSQYRVRWSLEVCTIPSLIPLIELFTLIASTGILAQLVIYKSTRGSNQGISRYCQGFIVTTLLPFLYLIKLWTFKQAKINELDLADYVWAMYKLFVNLQYCPQVMVNWMDDKVNGLHPYWLHLQLGYAVLELTDRVVNGAVWADVSILFPNLPLILIKDISLGILGLQYYIYREKLSEVHYKEV